MGLIEWAEKEVEIACKRENPDRKVGEWDYGCACYESALKAYKSLCEDGHSGFSWSVTRAILERLMNGQPLTPIEDTDDIWSEITCKHDGIAEYQCKRKSSLFKEVHPDGRIEYHDVDHCCVVEEGKDISWSSGFISKLIHQMFPIQMPYNPAGKPIKVVVKEELFNPEKGDYDAMQVKYCIRNGERIDINRYFIEGTRTWIEVDKDEYMKLRKRAGIEED